jgi:phage-related tail fiber protein
MQLYTKEKNSATEIAKLLECSPTKVNYWLKKHKITKRTISESVYIYNNPTGDPFRCEKNSSSQDWFLYGLGLGLFWGEGNKMNKHSVRLGNTDPGLINMFLLFLKNNYNIDESKLRFGLQVFSDIEPIVAKSFWIKNLGVSASQFQKVVVTPSRAAGTYTRKNQHGVLTIYFSNTKLRDIIVHAVTELQSGKMPT